VHQVRTARTVSLPFPKVQAGRFLVRVREMMVGIVGNDLLKKRISEPRARLVKALAYMRGISRPNQKRRSMVSTIDVRQGQFVFVH
jgi:hypothetical protein